jgi:hypothetical protein
MKSVAAGWALSRSQVNNSWWLRAALACMLTTLVGLLLEHRAAPSASRDNVLLTHSFGLVLPLLAWAASAKAFPRGLTQAVTPMAQHGANRRRVALGSALYLAVGTAVVTIASALLGVALGASAQASIVQDVFACLWIGALAAAGYTAWFLLASTFGQRGQGRWAFLLADWLLGSGISGLAAAWPRGHVRNLLGGQAVANLEQPHAAAVLGLLVMVYLTLALLRTPP